MQKFLKIFSGSLKENVISKLENGENVIFDIDWQGTRQIKKIKIQILQYLYFLLQKNYLKGY